MPGTKPSAPIGIQRLSPQFILRNRDNLIRFLARFSRRLNQNPTELRTRLINLIDRILPHLRDLREGTLTRSFESLKDILKDLRDLVQEYRRNRNGEMRGDERSEIRVILTAIANLLGKERTNNRPAAPVQTSNPTAPLRSNDELTRSQLLNNSLPNIHQLDQIQTISMARLMELFGKGNVSVRDLLNRLPVEVRTERSTPASEIIASVISNLILDKLVREILRTVPRTGDSTFQALERAVRELQAETIGAVVEVRTKSEGLVTRERTAEQLRAERELEEKAPASRNDQVREAPANERIICEIVYDRQGNIVRIEVSGRLHDRELIRTARELVNTRSAEVLPALAETALRAIERAPSQQADIIRFTSELLAKTAPAPVTSTWATEAVLIQIIHSLIAESRAIVAENFSQANVKLARTILAKAPQQALPVLLKEHSRISQTNPAAKVVVEQLISDLAKTADGQQYVLNAFAKGETQPLVASTIGKQVMVETVQAMVNQAKAQVTVAKTPNSKVSLQGKTEAEQLVQISQLIASANLAKLPADKINAKTAEACLTFVAQTQKVIRLINTKNLAKLEKSINSKVRKPAVTKTRKGRKAARVARNKQARQARAALKEMIRLQNNAKLALPKELYEIIGTHYAGLAGLSGLKDGLIIAPPKVAAQQSQETRQNSHLKRVVQAMEARLNKVQPKVSRNVQAVTTASTIQAANIVFGIIISRSRADRKKIEAVIKALRARGYMKDLIEAVEAGELDSVVDFINTLVLEAGVISQHGEMTEQAVTEAIELIESRVRDNQPLPLAA